MIKKNRIASTILILGLSASISVAQMPPELILKDCWVIFPSATFCERTRAIESGVLYTKVWQEGSWEEPQEFLGYVFLKSLQHEAKTIDVLVGMTETGVISRVGVKGIDGVDEEFLAQFRDKTSQNNFDVARTLEDLLFIPAKIKAMKGSLALSEKIAQGVREIAISAEKVIKQD